MPQGMDNTFHRLLWITLVAVAFTFTVILTSVFVDIDDLLAKRSSPVMKQASVTEALKTELPAMFVGDFQDVTSNEEDTDENESTYRTKRSLETNSYLLHIKNPKMKKALTKRLTTLLEELDEEESSKTTDTQVVVNLKHKNIVNPKYFSTEESVQNKKSVLNIKDTTYDKLGNEIDHNDILHLAMHNILLQGIIDHVDLNEVYKKIHLLIKGFETKTDGDIKENESKFNRSKPTELLKIIAQNSYNEEENFFNELIKCEKLQNQILQSQDLKVSDKKETAKDSHMIIKTTIEITNNNREKENFKNSNENTTGAVRLVYNGKEIKSVNMIDDKNVETEISNKKTQTEENQQNGESLTKKINTEWQNIKESELEQAIAEYLKTHSIKFHNKYNVLAKGSFITKRLKRQIKIRYLDDRVTTEKPKRLKGKPKHNDDELYVEIETHFDGKGTKGEKKKKLVRTLIDKIQKAINSNVEVLDQDKNVHQKYHQIKKRVQNPINHNEINVNTILPIDKIIEHRQLNPIIKTANEMQPLTNVLDKSGNTWKKIYNGPSFLEVSKAVNSAEMRELDIDYNSVMKNGIPKRLQKPINTENENLNKVNDYTDVGNVTLFLKDIKGSGFSIGINQYTDEPPDKESLKMFTGLENLIEAYHEHYDQAGLVSNESEEQEHYIMDTNHELKRRDVNKQTVLNKVWLIADRIMDKETDQDKLYEFTRSSRQKRSAMNVKLFSNIKSKTKLNKFINTNAMPTRKIFLKSKRNKRQIDKIRIVASDHYPPPSREDIFSVSRENIYADRAIVKEQEIPEVEIDDRNDEHYDFLAPYSYNVDMPNLQPSYLSSAYSTKSLHTGLMSKYPHIFLENISRSKDFIKISPSNTMIEQKKYRNENAETVNDDISNEKNVSSTNVDEIVNAILPSRNNFKVVVKIFPKNKTNLGPGYKEVHTLINKSYDKNGVRYVSSLNVSEVSKYESLNKTKDEIIPTAANNSETKRQQDQIKLLLELHKERIDQQLEHLKIESRKINKMIGHENLNKNMSHLIDVFRQLDFKSLYDRNYFRLNDNNATKKTTNKLTSNNGITMTPVTPVLTMSYQQDQDKMKILNLIKQNENITKVILEKIDNNTNIMQSFLQKLINQTLSTPQVNAEKVRNNDASKYLTENKGIPLFEQLHTNLTNAIPFIYAFQQPLIENNNKNNKLFKTVANVIYHGHIHANKVGNDREKNDFFKSVTNDLKFENNKTTNKNKGTNGNETKFFIDELENDFKVVTNFNDRNPVVNSVTTKITKD